MSNPSTLTLPNGRTSVLSPVPSPNRFQSLVARSLAWVALGIALVASSPPRLISTFFPPFWHVVISEAKPVQLRRPVAPFAFWAELAASQPDPPICIPG